MSITATPSALPRLRSLELSAIWKRTTRQSPAFLLTAFFVFLEYVRPVAAYGLGSLPIAQFTLFGAFGACLLEGKSSLREGTGWALIALFTVVILASSALAVFPSVAFAGLDLWISWLMIMFIISSVCDTEERLFLMIFWFLLWNLKMSQHSVRSWAGAGFAFRSWGVKGPPGWFANSGELAIEMCVFLPMVLYFSAALWPMLDKVRRWILPLVAASAVITIVASSSRGGLLGAAAVGTWIIILSPHRLVGTAGVAALTTVVWLVLPDEQRARFETAGDDGTSQHRLDYWADGIKIANDHPLLGIGYDNWLPYYLQNYRPNGALPHNIFIEAWAELGYIGLAVFLLLIGYVLVRNWRTRQITKPAGRNPNRFVYYMAYGLDGALIGYIVSGFFVTVLYYPYFWVNLAFTIALANVATSKSGAGTRRAALKRLGGKPLSRPQIATSDISPRAS